eukprot:CAMPEP_0170218618 /NCGR_PEP_ID=MMETSP0116_2-20130129/8979_1 /TAXON_ID=400756 /ORGANISM="Durinskia baltica, Strain CSIRO CS-38" /LENGTH=96 /DNA_ID=CAMNT_0010469261 /DNA_START=13 /DNA_END=300 /DNA_ORIENTATION=+
MKTIGQSLDGGHRWFHRRPHLTKSHVHRRRRGHTRLTEHWGFCRGGASYHVHGIRRGHRRRDRRALLVGVKVAEDILTSGLRRRGHGGAYFRQGNF